MKAFSNDFIRTLIEILQSDKSDLKNFLINLIEEEHDDPFVQSQPKDWGDQINQRAIPWAKRLYLLYRVKFLIKMYKQERRNYLSKERDKIDKYIESKF
jgi:hypothetical protein